MKKIQMMAAVLAGVCVLACACGTGGGDSKQAAASAAASSAAAVTEAPAASSAPAASETAKTVSSAVSAVKEAAAEAAEKVDVKELAEGLIGQKIDDVIAVAGEADEVSLSPSCSTNGDDGIYTWGNVTVYTTSEESGGDQIITGVE